LVEDREWLMAEKSLANNHGKSRKQIGKAKKKLKKMVQGNAANLYQRGF
jgi:hypothetical protein